MAITTFIKEDLSARIKSGKQLPTQLTIDALSEHYQVSFSPVRTAIAGLIDEGLVVKGPNRRLMAVPQPRSAGRSPKPPKLPPDHFAIISHDLVKLSLQGNVVILREEATAEKYGISRSAIRSILHRLAGEGVLDHVPRRGWRLRPFRSEDLQSFIEVREVLELKALDLAFPKLATSDLQRMLDATPLPVSPSEPLRIDESLHEYIISLAGNNYIRDFFERQGRYYRLLFQWEDHDPTVALETIRQHREILTALLQRNWSAARSALSRHILDNHPILAELGKQGGQK